MMVPQEIATAVLDPMSPSTLPVQFFSSTWIVWIIDALKRWKRFPWLSDKTDRLNQVAAVIGAAFTAAGIHFGLEPAVTGDTYTFIITGLSFAALVHFLAGFGMSLAMQQTILKGYQGINLLREIVASLKKK